MTRHKTHRAEKDDPRPGVVLVDLNTQRRVNMDLSMAAELRKERRAEHELELHKAHLAAAIDQGANEQETLHLRYLVLAGPEEIRKEQQRADRLERDAAAIAARGYARIWGPEHVRPGDWAYADLAGNRWHIDRWQRVTRVNRKSVSVEAGTTIPYLRVLVVTHRLPDNATDARRG